AGELPADRLVDGCPHRSEALLLGAVRVADAGLPAGEGRLVAEVEEEDALDLRLAARQLERAPVGGGLLVLRRRGRDLAALVEGALGGRDGGLDSDFPVE